MKRQIRNLSSQKGFVLVYMAATLTTLLLFAGLAVDTGRAYVVKAQLTKAVDGAALAAARSLNSGNPRNEAERVFKTNFPVGYLGTTAVTDPATAVGFFNMATNTVTGVNTVTVTATATVPTTFMRLANFTDLTVTSTGEATRRMVDLSLMLDVSSSIGSSWSSIQSAAVQFINGFDPAHDRFSLGTYGWGVRILDADAVEPWVQQDPGDGRRADVASGRHDPHGGRCVPGVGRAEDRVLRPAIESACHRAVH